jgi:hypothetical protein
MSSKNITFDNNVVGAVVDRTTIEAGPKFVDKAGGVQTSMSQIILLHVQCMLDLWVLLLILAVTQPLPGSRTTLPIQSLE